MNNPNHPTYIRMKIANLICELLKEAESPLEEKSKDELELISDKVDGMVDLLISEIKLEKLNEEEA
jgi:hypothetical protein